MSAGYATLLRCGASYHLSMGIIHKEADMNVLALSTLLFQAIASVALVLGVAAEAFFPARRA